MVKQVQQFKNGTFYIIKDGHAWLLYRFFSSKYAAQKAVKRLMAWQGHDRAKLATVYTNQGWGVFDLPKTGYRIKASQIQKYM